jgi:polyisoprenoid-binding protein YceI
MATTKWALEPNHSEVQFKVRHMMISNVTGHFEKFDANVETEEDDLGTAKVHFTADVDSIATNNKQRETHLKSADFFDADNHSQVKFEGTKMEKIGENKYKLSGNLTMRGNTHPITLDVEHGGTIKDPYGMTRCGFTVDGKLNRSDYGLTWNALTEAGGMVVSDEVKIHANVQFVKK